MRMGKQIKKTGCAICLATAMLVAGIGSSPIVGEAAPYGEAGSDATYEDKIWYEKDTTAFKALWTESTKGVPTKDGYVFGGWCTKVGENDYEMLTEAVAKNIKDGTTTADVYAKYVPAYVLSVRGQVDTKTYKSGAGRTESGSIRLVSATDSKEYQSVGFDVYLGAYLVKNEDGSDLMTNKVYNHIATPNGTTDATTAFGAKAKFLSVWKLDNITADKDAKIMKVTPYWITPDGTKVPGLTKYVHMEDGYESHMYVSVPITLRAAEEVAAGTITVTYPEGLKLIANNAVENGDIFTDGLAYQRDDENRTIQFVANTADGNASAAGLYVNLRFQKEGGVTAPAHWEFTTSGEQFCNWNEEFVPDIRAWDIQY